MKRLAFGNILQLYNVATTAAAAWVLGKAAPPVSPME